MSTPSTRLAFGLVLLASFTLAGCDQGAGAVTASPMDATASAGTAAPTAPPSDPVPTSAAPSAGAATAETSPAPPVGQTETDFGTIWEGVPAGFPRFTGGRDADDAGPAPVSDVYAVEGGDAAVVAEWLQSAMEAATYSTEGLSGPLEDGSFELVSVGDAGCRIRTTVVPQGNLVLVSILYGAACPAA